jgi:hypothetical protein
LTPGALRGEALHAQHLEEGLVSDALSRCEFSGLGYIGTVELLQTSQRLASGEETGYGLGWDLETVTLAASLFADRQGARL